MFYVCRTTPFNATLIPYTDWSIQEAISAMIPSAIDCYEGGNSSVSNELLREMHNRFQTGKPMVTFDCIGKTPYHLSPIPTQREKISHYSDAPYGQTYEFIKNNNPPGATVTYGDRNWKQFFDDNSEAGIFDFDYVFMPLAGPNTIKSVKPIQDRKYDISFVGRLINPEPLGAFESILSGSDPRLISIFKNASEQALHDGKDVYIAYKEQCLAAGFSPFKILNATMRHKILGQLVSWVELQHRLALLRQFKSTPIDMFGPVYEEIKGVTDQDHKFHGPKMGADVLKILADTKILINSVTVTQNGSNERIWYGIAYGAVPYTDPSLYIKEYFEDEKSILYIDYDNLANNAAKIIEYSNDNDLLQKIIENAQPIYLKNHTWTKRIADAFSQMAVVQSYLDSDLDTVIYHNK